MVRKSRENGVRGAPFGGPAARVVKIVRVASEFEPSFFSTLEERNRYNVFCRGYLKGNIRIHGTLWIKWITPSSMFLLQRQRKLWRSRGWRACVVGIGGRDRGGVARIF